MDHSEKFWLVVMGFVLVGVLGIAAAIAIPLTYSHQQEVKRDVYYATHCKMVNQYTANNGGQTFRQYQCVNK